MGGRSVLRSLRAATVIAAATLALAAPATAPGHPPKTIRIPIPAFTSISARAAASHGYRLELSGRYEAPVRQEADGVAVSYLGVTLRKGSTKAEYTVASAVAPDGTIAASLGSLGRLALRFVPRQVTEPRFGPDCEHREKVERGVLRGTIAFRGEGGYSHLAATALPATLTSVPETLCTYHPPPAPRSSESIRFGGGWSRGRNRSIYVSTGEHPRLGIATLWASSSERRGQVGITRYAKAVVPAGDAPFDQSAGTASVAPPAPFTGSARFSAFPGKEAGTWLGSLAADFPGDPGVHLAGHRFEGSLLSGSECGPDEPGTSCIGVRFPAPIGLDPVRAAEPPPPAR